MPLFDMVVAGTPDPHFAELLDIKMDDGHRWQEFVVPWSRGLRVADSIHSVIKFVSKAGGIVHFVATSNNGVGCKGADSRNDSRQQQLRLRAFTYVCLREGKIDLQNQITPSLDAVVNAARWLGSLDLTPRA
jgi:hypothetical protein